MGGNRSAGMGSGNRVLIAFTWLRCLALVLAYGDPNNAPLRIPLAPLSWDSCPFVCDDCITPATHVLLCANMSVPLDWDQPTGDQITFHLSSFRLVSQQQRKSAVWVLEGGPGGDGFELLPRVGHWLTALPNSDVILPDHRGTGFSNRLVCDYDGPQMMICVNQTIAEHGPDYLTNFNPTAAALDVMHGIAANAQSGEEAHVYGVSYGTKWTNRYLQIAPEQPSTVIVDGICSSNLCRIQTYDLDLDAVGRELLGLCERDLDCNNHLGGRFATRLAEDVFEALDDQSLSCAKLLSQPLDRSTLGIILSHGLAIWDARVLIVPLLLRLARCSASDQVELKNFFSHVQVPLLHSPMPRVTTRRPGDSLGRASIRVDLNVERLPSMGSNLLGNNIIMSEMFTPYWTDQPFTLDEVKQQAATLMFTTHSTESNTELYPLYPKYKPDQYTGKIAQVPSELPLLILNGDLDQATSYAWAVNYSNTVNKQLVSFKQAVHATALGNTPMKDPSVMDCAAQVVTGFFNSSGSKPDLSCMDGMQTLDLGGELDATKQISMEFFNTTKLWGSG